MNTGVCHKRVISTLSECYMMNDGAHKVVKIHQFITVGTIGFTKQNIIELAE